MTPDPLAFARYWEDAWNRRDLDAVLSLFHEAVTFSSPYGATILPDSGGVFRGKRALRRYWEQGLAALPDLHFVVEDVFVGVDAMALRYRNQRGRQVVEMLVFEDGLVRSGHGAYPWPEAEAVQAARSLPPSPSE